MDLDQINDSFQKLLFPNGKFDTEAFKKLAAETMAAENEQAGAVLQAPTRTPEQQIELSTLAATQQEPLVIRSTERQLDAADRLGGIGTREYKGRIGAVTDAQKELLGMGYDAHGRQMETDSRDYNTLMNKTFDARDKDRALMQRGQTMNLIKNILGGAAILFN